MSRTKPAPSTPGCEAEDARVDSDASRNGQTKARRRTPDAWPSVTQEPLHRGRVGG
jgi:hypothetical protein